MLYLSLPHWTILLVCLGTRLWTTLWMCLYDKLRTLTYGDILFSASLNNCISKDFPHDSNFGWLATNVQVLHTSLKRLMMKSTVHYLNQSMKSQFLWNMIVCYTLSYCHSYMHHFWVWELTYNLCVNSEQVLKFSMINSQHGTEIEEGGWLLCL